MGEEIPLRCFFSWAMRASRPDTYWLMNGSSSVGIPAATSSHSSSAIEEGQELMFLIRASILLTCSGCREVG